MFFYKLLLIKFLLCKFSYILGYLNNYIKVFYGNFG